MIINKKYIKVSNRDQTAPTFKSIIFCTFVNLFCYFPSPQQIMKNPFLDTAKYAVVRQFNRLASKKRSVSQTCRSFKSPQSFPIYPYDYYFTDSLHFSSGNYNRYNTSQHQLEHEFKKNFIQKKRFSILDIEQLRYRPNSLTNYSNLCSSSLSDKFQYSGLATSLGEKNYDQINNEKNYQTEKISSSIEDETGYQKLFKQKDEVLNVLPQDSDNYQQQMSQYEIRIRPTPQSVKEKRESSIGGTLLRISTYNKNMMRNYEYASMVDADLVQNNRCIQNLNKKRRLKKPSIFQQSISYKKLQPQCEKQNKGCHIRPNKKQKKRSVLRELQVSQKQAKEYNERKRQDDRFQNSKLKEKPPLIQIRGQVFYLQEKIKKKY